MEFAKTETFMFEGVPLKYGQPGVRVPKRPGWEIAFATHQPFGIVVCWRKIKCDATYRC